MRATDAMLPFNASPRPERSRACFVSTLQRQDRAPPRMKRRGARLAASAGEKTVPDILLVDDDPSFADYIATLLRRDGHRVTAVCSGVRALDHLSAHPCHIVITDVLMPDMDGIELLREIRQRGLDIVVIGITGADLALNGLITRLFEAMGAAFVAPKPIEPQDFLARLGRHAERFRSEPAA